VSRVLLDKLLGELVLVSTSRSASSGPDVHVGSRLLDELALSGFEQRLVTLNASLSCSETQGMVSKRSEEL